MDALLWDFFCPLAFYVSELCNEVSDHLSFNGNAGVICMSNSLNSIAHLSFNAHNSIAYNATRLTISELVIACRRGLSVRMIVV